MHLAATTQCVMTVLANIGVSEIFTITNVIDEVKKKLHKSTEDISHEVFVFMQGLHFLHIIMCEKNIPGPHSPVWIPEDQRSIFDRFLKTKTLA